MDSTMKSCLQCGFELYKPISVLHVSNLGLYDDDRFPGRCILSLHHHYEDLTEVPENLMNAYMDDIRHAMKTIKNVTGCSRVNLAILGNAVPHVHAHLIPRYPEREENPNQSPWNDPRMKNTLDPILSRNLIQELANAL